MHDKIPRPNVFADAPAAIAKSFGVTAKALRVYESLGLIRPARTASGWRAYGQAEIERLATIVALKQLGLPLKRIKTLLSGAADLSAALALQEAALEAAQAQTDETLRLVRAARKRLATQVAPSTDELATLIRSTKMSEFKWTPKMDEMAAKHYTPEQLAELKARPFTAADQARVGAAWQSVWSDIDKLGADPDATTEQSLSIGRRAHALVAEFTQGDPALFKAAGAMNSEMMKDPKSAQQMPTHPGHWQFIGAVFAELKKRGEI
jgi:DNA-binding transcriptional MerR regulator